MDTDVANREDMSVTGNKRDVGISILVSYMPVANLAAL